MCCHGKKGPRRGREPPHVRRPLYTWGRGNATGAMVGGSGKQVPPLFSPLGAAANGRNDRGFERGGGCGAILLGRLDGRGRPSPHERWLARSHNFLTIQNQRSLPGSACVQRILISPTNLPQRPAVTQHMLEQRIVIEHIHRSRMISQTLLEVRQHSPQS